jgi:hypothetical protein
LPNEVGLDGRGDREAVVWVRVMGLSGLRGRARGCEKVEGRREGMGRGMRGVWRLRV